MATLHSFHPAIARIGFIAAVVLGTTLGAHAASAATLSLTPSNASVTVGGTFVERVLVSSTDQAMNAVSGTISFPAGTVQVVSVSKGATIPLWVQDPAYSNTDGTITFSGVVPNPGYQGSGGTVLTIVFRATTVGSATIRFANSSVLANDGQGTELLTSAPSATVTIGAPAATAPAPTQTPTPKPTPEPSEPSKHSTVGPLGLASPTHPDQSAWYGSSDITVTWENPASVTQVRTGYDTDPDGQPTILYTNRISGRTIDGDDGTTYFHLQVRDEDGWGPVSTYRFNIDTQAPSSPAISYVRGTPPIITFSSSDTLSGMQGYEVRVNDGTPVSVSTTSASYDLSPLPSGLNTVEVAAIDVAGNRATSSAAVILIGASNGWTDSLWHILMYSSPIILLLLMLAALAYLGWFLWNRFTSMRARSAFRSQAANRTLTQQFAELREALTEEEGALNQLDTTRELTLEERRFFKRFTTQLDKAEQLLERKITHIPD